MTLGKYMYMYTVEHLMTLEAERSALINVAKQCRHLQQQTNPSVCLCWGRVWVTLHVHIHVICHSV